MKVRVKNTISELEFLDEKTVENREHLTVYYGTDHLFCGDISRFYLYLSEKEIQRSKRFLKKTDERVYVLSHALLNREISARLNTDFEKLKINYFESRKPYIKDSSIDFNLSHSSDCFAFALGCKKNIVVGVDIENIKENLEFESIVKHYFHENEIKFVLNGSVNHRMQLQRFYEIWTRKEAFFKMLGLGLSEKFPETDLSPGEREIFWADNCALELAPRSKIFVSTFIFPDLRVLSVAANTPSLIIPIKCNAF